MSTTMVESWAVDLAEVGPIYPLVGSEGIWVILGVIFWIGWHVWQIKFENNGYDRDKERLGTKEALTRAMKERRLD